MNPNDLLSSAQSQALAQNQNSMYNWADYKNELKSTQILLGTLPDKLSHSVMVPIGSRAFMPGRIVHSNEYLVNLGSGYMAKKTAKQAWEFCERRIQSCDEMLEKLENELSLLTDKMFVPNENEAFGSEERPEIIEHVTEEEDKEWRIQHREREKAYMAKLAEMKTERTKIESEQDLWNRLDELELEEELEDELHRLNDGESDESDVEPDMEEKLDEEVSEEIELTEQQPEAEEKLDKEVSEEIELTKQQPEAEEKLDKVVSEEKIELTEQQPEAEEKLDKVVSEETKLTEQQPEAEEKLDEEVSGELELTEQQPEVEEKLEKVVSEETELTEQQPEAEEKLEKVVSEETELTEQQPEAEEKLEKVVSEEKKLTRRQPTPQAIITPETTKRKRSVIFVDDPKTILEPLFLNFRHSSKLPQYQSDSNTITSPSDIHAKYLSDLKNSDPVSILKVKTNPNGEDEFLAVSKRAPYPKTTFTPCVGPSSPQARKVSKFKASRMKKN